MSDEECLSCHGDESIEGITKRGEALNLFTDEKAIAGSVHEGLSCTDCHVGETSWDDVPHAEKGLTKACKDCHSDVFAVFSKKDVHGRAAQNGNEKAPDCGECHGGHGIHPLNSDESVMSKENQPEACGKCHGSEFLNREEGITKRKLVERYKSSVHWDAIQMGKNGASCTDCHGHHTILSSAEPDSTVSREGVIKVCNNCHPNEAMTFLDGAHGRPLKQGNNDVPSCVTCHGDHDMASLSERTGDAKSWAATQVCIWCHNNERMMARYGLDTSPVESYMKDFHGLTQRTTQGASATCADCHDPHHSLPSTHPSSRMHLSNRGSACGKCHGQVTDTFALSFSHKKAMQDTGSKIEVIIKWAYILIIIASVLGMLLHNFIIWLHGVTTKLKEQRRKKSIRRMNRYEIFSHMVMFITFSILVITGFALKFPEAFWSTWLHNIGMTEPIRAFIHRSSGFLMTVDIAVFCVYMIIIRRGRIILKEMIPTLKDLKGFFDTFKYYLGFSDKAPKYNVFSYAEKFEFWALIWGVAIMAVTGFFLWFPKSIPDSWPHWLMNVARVIHYYEALLASLAIVIWHGFHVMFHPHEFPMSTSWLTGYVTKEEAEHHFTPEAIRTMAGSGDDNNGSEDGKESE